jgi:pimeloyl-ACP methyl ester carboxylesterase
MNAHFAIASRAVAKLDIETIEDAGHHLHLDRPDAVAARIRKGWGMQ